MSVVDATSTGATDHGADEAGERENLDGEELLAHDALRKRVKWHVEGLTRRVARSSDETRSGAARSARCSPRAVR